VAARCGIKVIGVPFPPPKSPEKGARWLSSPGVSRDSGASFSGYTPDIVIGVAAATPLRYEPDDDPGKGSVYPWVEKGNVRS